MGLFDDRTHTADSKTQVPVWFMRQAGRYHSHYQNIKKSSDFMSMCKIPTLATEVTLGPITDFDFDAAILFSDILFPLEQLGMGLSYAQGHPEINFKLEASHDLDKIKIIQEAKKFYSFQADALKSIKQLLPKQKTLLGFIGAPFTLFTYAVEGSHAGNLVSSKRGLYDGRFDGFMDRLLPELAQNAIIQGKAGADAVCIFDTAAGELCHTDYKAFIIPKINLLTKTIKENCPTLKIVYYSKLTHIDYLTSIEDSNIDVIGIDWRQDINSALDTLASDYYIQGNLDPAWLHLPWNHLQQNLHNYWQNVKKSQYLDRWICGLGHGVLVNTPEDNVRKTVEFIHRHYTY